MAVDESELVNDKVQKQENDVELKTVTDAEQKPAKVAGQKPAKVAELKPAKDLEYEPEKDAEFGLAEDEVLNSVKMVENLNIVKDIEEMKSKLEFLGLKLREVSLSRICFNILLP